MSPNTLRPILCCIALLWLANTALGQSLGNWEEQRNRMVDDEVVGAGVENERVIEAIRSTPRHEFVPRSERSRAYYDMALPIGSQQTISPPFIVAYMTEQIDPQPSDRVLEIGTGSGYQAAVLSGLVRDVYSIEIVPQLGRQAEKTLRRLKYKNVHTKIGDGFLGWPDAAPFDKIIVTCSPEKVPQPLIDQLADDGLMIIPVGERYQQNFYLFRKRDGELESEALRATLFVPMTGKAEDRRQRQPDPKNPELVNGDFESVVGENELPEGWHYLRQAEVIENQSEAAQGQRYMHFANEDPGRGCRALQGFAIDGRAVSHLRVSFRIRGKTIRPGQDRTQWPYVAITFYDKRRGMLGTEVVGPFRGTFDWTTYDRVIEVPVQSREAIIRIGLLGATGELDVDGLNVAATKP
ncbi:protein-L-isoaspartate(D-aspartate) O-methyltransferase [Aeoliella sp.]|uniref:protein-L-isoaspartate(D-aspartate) O-methyltransferase n=1 Tax=Aeoliella sp. TaxID=2795800 RepID=UPI003CCC25F9